MRLIKQINKKNMKVFFEDIFINFHKFYFLFDSIN